MSESVSETLLWGRILEGMVAFTAVRTTGIYCRPGCSARPHRDNTRLFDIAAAAEAEGFRPCLRCRPYRAAPPAFMSGPDIVCRGVGMILDGFLDSSTEGDMADHLGVSSRHLRRLFRDHVGVTPNELAKSSRAHFARRLLDDTDLTVTEITFAAGFGSVRQMNRVVREIFRSSPTELRAKRRKADRLVADGGLPLRLPFDGPLDWQAIIRHLMPRTIPGVEHITDSSYRRTVMIDGDPGILEIEPMDHQHLVVVAHLPHWEGLIHIARRASAIFGLTAPTDAARDHLRDDPVLGSLVDQFPGVRVPGTWDPFETAVLAMVGQERSQPKARAVAGQLARRHGRFIPGLSELGLTHVFPDAEALANQSLSGIDVSDEVRQSIRQLSRAMANGEAILDSSREIDDLIASLRAIPGLKEETAQYIAWRLGLHDAFPITPAECRDLTQRSMGDREPSDVSPEEWQPWRSMATAYLRTARRNGWYADRKTE